MKDRPLSYWITVGRMGFENDFHRLFDQLGISRADLAARLDVSAPYVSKVLNGTAGNYELATMAKWARAIGAILQISLIKEGEEVVRVVDYETARALDERHLMTVAPPTTNKVVDIEAWKNSRADEVAASASSEVKNYG